MTTRGRSGIIVVWMLLWVLLLTIQVVTNGHFEPLFLVTSFLGSIVGTYVGVVFERQRREKN